MSRLPPLPALLALVAMGCAEEPPAPEPYRPAPCNATQLPAPAHPIVCPDRVIRYDEAAQGEPGAPRCVPFVATPCRCSDGAAGVDACSTFGHPTGCFCDQPSDPRDIDGMGAPPPPLPARLVAPLSGQRATTTRPTFRWVPPDGVARARVELCDDRPCARVLDRAETAGRAWRPARALRPGVVFWRVTGLGAGGAATWTSATWEVGVPYRDTPVDSVSGPIRDVNGDAVDDVVLKLSYRNGEDYHALRFIPGYVGAAHVAAPTQYALDRQFDVLDYDMALGDINGDGMGDVLTVTASGNRAFTEELAPFAPVARVLWGGRQCPFTTSAEVPLPFPRDTPARYGSIGDFDGDGFGDVVGASSRGAYLVRGSSEGLQQVPADFAAIATSAAVEQAGALLAGDFDGDGYADLAVSNYEADDGDGEVRIFHGNPRARLDERVEVLHPHGGNFGLTLTVLDFTGDGRADLAVGSSGGFDLYAGAEGRLRFVERVVFRQAGDGAPFFAPLSGDFDGDGRTELTSGRIYRSQGLGGYLGASVAYPLGDVPTYYLSPRGSPGDVDGDGFDDLVGFGGPRFNAGARRFVTLHLGGSLAFCAPVRAWEARDEDLLHP